VFDAAVLLDILIPLLILFGVSILTMTLAHLVLSTNGNQFATEISSILGLVVFVGIEVVLGIFTLHWTLLMLFLVTPLMLFEALRSGDGREGDWPKALEIDDGRGGVVDDVLCFSIGRKYAALAAIAITGIPIEDEKTLHRGEEDDELKWLYPLWEDSQQSHVTYTVEAKTEKGMASLRIFVSSNDKDWKQAMEKALRARLIVETWLTRKEYGFEIILADQLWRTYLELDYGVLRAPGVPAVAESERASLGVLSVEGVPKSFSSDLGQLLEMKVSGHVLVSFTSGPVPRLGRDTGEVRGDPQHQPRVPFRVEEHKLRKTYEQMAEIEACEETGSFRVGVSILVHERSASEVEYALKQVSAAVRSVWGGVKVMTVSVGRLRRAWGRLLLRNHLRGTASVSGARLTGLLQMSTALPGVATRIVPPEFALPAPTSLFTDSVTLGHLLRKGKPIAQQYGIPTSSFCLHTGIYGNTGSGKTNTALHLVHQLHQRDVPFLVIVPAKKEWRQLGNLVSDLRIFTAGDEETAPFRYNPFEVPPGVSISKHIDGLITCFTAAWPTEGILVEHIAKVFRRVYSITGWDVLENKRGREILLTDLYRAMEIVASELEYGLKLNQDFVGALKARFGSVIDDPQLAVILNSEKGITIPELLSSPTVIELNSLPPTKASLIGSLILVGVAEYLEAQNKSTEQELKHILVIEEAHHLLKRINTGGGLYESHSSQQQAINSIVSLLREARGYGLGVVILDQLPGELADAAVKLPGITIIHLLKDPRERAIVGGQANLNDEQLFYIGALEVGEAIVHQGFAKQAVNIRVDHFQPVDSSGETPSWNNYSVSKLMQPLYEMHKHLEKQSLPIIDTWRPNPLVLRNLEYIIESEDFARNLEKYLEPSSGLAKVLVERLLRKHHVSAKPEETKRYVSLFINYLNNPERCTDERK